MEMFRGAQDPDLFKQHVVREIQKNLKLTAPQQGYDQKVLPLLPAPDPPLPAVPSVGAPYTSPYRASNPWSDHDTPLASVGGNGYLSLDPQNA